MKEAGIKQLHIYDSIYKKYPEKVNFNQKNLWLPKARAGNWD